MTRIYIIGGPGSGKTTLAKRVAQQLTLPCYEMDQIGWENGFGAFRAEEVRLHEVQEIAQQDDWVAEGWFSPWTDALAQRAEQIVWLDLPWRVARWRIISRHMRASLAGTNKHRGLRKLYQFLVYAKHYYTHEEGTRAQLAKELQPFMPRVVQCRRPAEVEAWFARLSATSAPEPVL